jgi:DNA invertase Pin-like site-specific DNA recombinase
MIQCVLYAQVSLREQEREGYSIPAQEKLLREYAVSNGMTIAREFVDVETAKVTGRTGFNEMLSYLGSSLGCSIILVEKTDRLYRNIKDWVTVDELEVEVHFVKESIVLSKDSKSSDKFLHGIKVLMAKNYCDNLSEEVKKGLTEKASQGAWPARAPIGYITNKEAHLIEPDPQKAHFIVRLFQWYSTGEHSLKRLSELAKESGLFSRNSMAINKAGIHRILNNPIYYGEFIWKGKRYLGKHKPLIPKILFDQVQDVFGAANHPKETKRGYAFAGLVKCHLCGCSMTPEIKKGRYIYYHCTQAKGKCNNTYVREEMLSDLFADVIKKIHIDEDTVEDIKKALMESQEDKVEYHRKSIGSLRSRYDRVQRMMDRAYEDKLNGKVPEQLWERKSVEWNNDLVNIQFQIKSHESANLEYCKTGVEILELANQAYDMYLQQSCKEQRKLLNIILSNCTFDRGTLCPTYNKPFDILAKGSGCLTKRG